jgi:hypothetical protein
MTLIRQSLENKIKCQTSLQQVPAAKQSIKGLIEFSMSISGLY